jgi:hypothetical protein
VTQGHMDRDVGSSVPLPAFLCVDCFFLSSRIGCVLCKDNGGLHLLFVSIDEERRAKRRTAFVVGQKIIRIIFCQSGSMSKKTGSSLNCCSRIVLRNNSPAPLLLCQAPLSPHSIENQCH